MARHLIARVAHNQLLQLTGTGGEHPPIPVGTGAWYSWLSAEETRSFTYHSSAGNLTARREARQGSQYWYAYRTMHGKLHKVYLGRAKELSQQRLDHALRKLNEYQVLNRSVCDTRGTARSAEPPFILLKTKLAPPLTPEYLVTRPRLLHVLQAGETKPLTLLSAPAGFGKTTLLSEWARTLEHPCAWISLESEDNDPLRFLACLIESLQQAHCASGSGISTRVYAIAQQASTRTIVALFNELASLPTEVTLIFDNYQVIENPLIHNALTFLLEHAPAHIHVLIASRNALPGALARLRASGKIAEVGASALRFTRAEVEQLVFSRLHIGLGPEDLALLERRTEGWIAGLYLASLALREQQDASSFLAHFAGDNPYILNYLLEEVLERQPAQAQSFLLATSVLECLNGALCAAVMDQANAIHMLEHLEGTSLLLFPCEQQVGWYRYHPLLAEALRHHLEQTWPDMVAILHARASRWFEEKDMLEKAIEHALAAHHIERAASLIERVAPALLARGDIAALPCWLAGLPETAVHASPRLCITSAYLAFIISQPGAFSDWIAAAEQALCARQEALPPLAVTELQSEIAGLHALSRITNNDFSSALAICQQALQQLPPGNLYPRGLLLLLSGFAYTRGRHVNAGARAVSEASHLLQITGHTAFLPYILMIRTEIYLTQGYLIQAATLCRQVLVSTTEPPESAIFSASVAHVSLGHVFWEWNNLTAARSHLLQAWEAGIQAPTKTIPFAIALLLSLVSHAQGEIREANCWLQQMETLAQQTRKTEPLELVATVRARLFLAEGRVENALLWMRERHYSLEDPASMRVEFEYHTQVRVLIAAARAYADSSYIQQALKLLECLRAAAEEAGRTRSLLEVLMLQSLALQQEGDIAGALGVLERAVTLAEPGRYIRLFVGEGDPMARLLRQLLEQKRLQRGARQAINLTYLANVLKAFAPSAPSTLRTSSIVGEPVLDPLSGREHEVLRLLATGRKNREIADELVVATGTVKAHINTIYQKLGVSSRVQAVVRARALGLL